MPTPANPSPKETTVTRIDPQPKRAEPDLLTRLDTYRRTLAHRKALRAPVTALSAPTVRRELGA